MRLTSGIVAVLEKGDKMHGSKRMIVCICFALLLAGAFMISLPEHASAEDRYYSETRRFTINPSMSWEEKIKILREAFPHGWFWNCHTENELNGKRQIQVTVNQDVYYISQLACTAKKRSSHDYSKDYSLCQGYGINKYVGGYSFAGGTGGRQCTGFARMIFTYLWGKPTVSVRYSEDSSLLSYVQRGDLIYDGSHSYIILNNPNQENGSVQYLDCNGDGGGLCKISWKDHGTIYRNTLEGIQDHMSEHKSSAYVVLHHAKSDQPEAEVFTPVGSATKYEVLYSKGLRIRLGPGTSYGTAATMKKGTIFFAYDSSADVKPADGHTWAYSYLENGTTGWIAIDDSSLCAPVTGIIPVSALDTYPTAETCVGSECVMIVDVMPSNATNQILLWSVADESIAAISFITSETTECVLIGKSDGTTVLTCETTDGSGVKLEIPVIIHGEHKPGDWVVKREPTESESGYAVRICEYCLEEVDTKEIPWEGPAPFPPAGTTEYEVVYSGGLKINKQYNKTGAAIKTMPKGTHFWADMTTAVKAGNYTWAYSYLPDGTEGWVAVSNPDYCAPVQPDRLPGDVTGDGVVDGRDVLRLMKYFAGQDVTIDERNADVTGDGAVDGRDVLRLMKYFAGLDVELK